MTSRTSCLVTLTVVCIRKTEIGGQIHLHWDDGLMLHVHRLFSFVEHMMPMISIQKALLIWLDTGLSSTIRRGCPVWSWGIWHWGWLLALSKMPPSNPNCICILLGRLGWGTNKQCRDVYLHPTGRYRIFQLSEAQIQQFVGFASSSSSSYDESKCPLPFSAEKSARRIDAYDALGLHIYRDPYERRLPEERPRRAVINIDDYPEYESLSEQVRELCNSRQGSWTNTEISFLKSSFLSGLWAALLLSMQAIGTYLS